MDKGLKKILLLGDTGKVGNAIRSVMSKDFIIIGKNSSNFDPYNFKFIENVVQEEKPEIVINTIAMMGIDPCELDPAKAFLLNAMLPKALAELSAKYNFVLVHFSTDAVFNDSKHDFYTEADTPSPLNIYGATKYSGDCLIQALAVRYYIFRISVLFGHTEKRNQFVEKMLQKVDEGAKLLRISKDIISSPSYSIDIASKLKFFLKNNEKYGLYHIANEGKASLFDIIKYITEYLRDDIVVEDASYLDFPFLGIKNTFTPLKSMKTSPLRPWKEAIEDYCKYLSKVI